MTVEIAVVVAAARVGSCRKALDLPFAAAHSHRAVDSVVPVYRNAVDLAEAEDHHSHMRVLEVVSHTYHRATGVAAASIALEVLHSLAVL